MTDTKFKIAFLIYPGMTQLDFIGPAEVLRRMPDADVKLVWKTLDPVEADCGISFLPHVTLDDPAQYDMICVPGGFSCSELMEDEAVLSWLRDQADAARYVTSVCTGSLVLAAAGLLNGYKAGCHWAWGEHLSKFGAEFTHERVVIDRNRITAGGVTAGIDFGFRILRERLGADFEAAIRLGIEYNPEAQPGGVPATARPEILSRVQAVTSERMGSRIEQIDRVATRFA